MSSHPSQSRENEPSAQPRPPFQPPSSRASFVNTFNYFTEPLTYSLTSIARRLSEDEAPTPLAKALSAQYNGSLMDVNNGVYHPPQPTIRRPSPFQPPPLTPLSLRGYRDTTGRKARLLSRAVAEEIRLLIPPRLQLQDHWTLVYSMEQNGSSLSTLYKLADVHRGKRAGFVLVIRDAGGGTFGAYLTDTPNVQPHYYGSGECFLWRAFRLPALPDLSSLPPPPSADTTHSQRMTTLAVSRQNSSASLASLSASDGLKKATNGKIGHLLGGSMPERIRFKAFPYTGENDFTIFCQHEYLSVGGGDGHYGLWLDDNLSKGVSSTCLTFGNEPLSDEGTKFDVLGVELWYVGA
ncbi:oxidation resistance protein 1 [Elasticomyces elasticus]|nr:oxidation resistance protein 1 [Elasticomyces elasticus]KAK3635083.1 oxidation resistance protein 1 [Elasticomyces elasticus]KAK4906760.1 oxidation resistance protein 1 [Elasticomyces elasticus]KAK5769309.1 oxidation resistance protein 1 [Elasticomyces elasticus]